MALNPPSKRNGSVLKTPLYIIESPEATTKIIHNKFLNVFFERLWIPLFNKGINKNIKKYDETYQYFFAVIGNKKLKVKGFFVGGVYKKYDKEKNAFIETEYDLGIELSIVVRG